MLAQSLLVLLKVTPDLAASSCADVLLDKAPVVAISVDGFQEAFLFSRCPVTILLMVHLLLR